MFKKGLLKQQIESIRHSPWGFFIKRLRVTILVVIALIIGGFFGLFSMPLDSDPEVEIPIGVITTVFLGASPSDVEKLVTDRLETHLKNLDNLKHLTSSSSEGISSVIVEFEASADIKESMRELRDEVDKAKPELPEEAEEPVVTEIRADDSPPITFSIVGNCPPEDFKFFGEELKERLERVSGISRVMLSGVEEKEMQVLIDIKALEGFGLSLSQIVNTIQLNNFDFPIGNILTNGFYYSVSLKGQLTTEEELLELPIANIDGKNIYLKDIAEVREVFAEEKTKTRLYQHSIKEYKPSVTLQVYRTREAGIIDVADAAKNEANRFQQDILPPNVEILITGDWAEYIHEDIGVLRRSGLQAITIIFLLLFLALGFKEALLSAMSIPLIFLISIFLLFLYGETLNWLVIFGLILSFGLIVDASIVMMEGIHENMKNKRLSPEDSALLAIKTYKAPLISSTFTTIFAFMPIAMLKGVTGEYTKHIPITVSITLLTSLFVAIFILTAFAFYIFRNHKFKIHERPPLANRFIVPLREWYTNYIKKILASKSSRRRWIAGMFIASAVAISFPFIGVLKIHLFPEWNANYSVVEIKGPLGSTLEDTSEVTKKIEKFIEELPELENFVTIIGGSPLAATGFYREMLYELTSLNRANITVNLTKKRERELKSYEISEMLREKVKGITEAKVVVKDLDIGPPGVGAPIEVRVIGEDIQAIEAFAKVIEKELKQVEGTRDVNTDIEHGPGEFQFKIKRDQLEYYGLSVAQWGNEIRTAVFGSSGIKILRAGEETPIVVRLDFRDEECKQDKITQILEKRDEITICNLNPKNISQIKRLLIPTPRGQIPLGQLVDIELKPTITTIRHRDAEMVVNVQGFTKKGILPIEAMGALKKRMKDIPIPKGIRLDYSGEMEQTTESFEDLGRAMAIGIILIVFILVLQFNSFRQPFIVLFTLPLALIGAFFGLALLGRDLSVAGFVGIAALSGIVVNDAIIFIDRINSNISNGMARLKAIIQAGKERFQPIILTTVTTAAGILPIIFTHEAWAEMAWVIFFGIIFATVLTLIMVPIFYTILEKVEE